MNTMNRVLVVDDEAGMRVALQAHFERRDWQVETAANAAEALEKFRRGRHPLVVTDIRMPDPRHRMAADGFAVMREARLLAPHTAVILLTAFANVSDAVNAIKGGACDYLVKPVCFDQLELAAERILAQARAQSSAVEEEGLAGRSPAWLRALDRVRQAAASGADVLIEAESGTGKELVARLLHRLSARRDHPFVAVNCAAFPETLLESELFGYARGAFTGALAAKPGRFEMAHRGTILLDEVGEMPIGLQPKLLRVLQEREFERLGDNRSVRVDVRVIATTNRSLAEMVRQGQFRADLYYRLNVIPLSLPPLRERGEDIRGLAEHFLRLYSPQGRSLHLSAEFVERIEAQPWPGNVRELANRIRRAAALATDTEIGAEALADLPDGLGPSKIDQAKGGQLQDPRSYDKQSHDKQGYDKQSNAKPENEKLENEKSENFMPGHDDRLRAGVSLEEMERRLVAMTLEATGGNRSRAAGLLGVSLRTVRNKIRDYGLPSWSSYVHD
jgi:DNA-binding NtrC family response regulator